MDNNEQALPLGKRIASFYARQFQFIGRMKRFIWISALIFIVVAVSSYIYFYRYYDFSKPLPSVYERIFAENDFRPGSMGTFFKILLNNLRADFLLCLAGLIPFFLPSAYFLFLNGGMIGLVLAMMAKMNLPVIKLFSTDIMPHGMIELPTFIFTAGFALSLSSQMTKRIIRKKPVLTTRTGDLFGHIDQTVLPNRREAFGDILRLLAGVILPLVVIAAFLETFVTPYVYGWLF